MTDVTIILNLHREGALAHPTMRALGASIAHAARHGRRTEVLVVVDRGDLATTDLAREALAVGGTLSAAASSTLLEVDHGDLGESRNSGVRAAASPVVGILDGDNLVCETWVLNALRTVEDAADTGGPVVARPSYLVVFDDRYGVFPSIGGDDPRFRPHLLYEVNYWDAFCMARRDLLLQYPWVRTDPGSGLGPEDWHWNCLTLADGVRHVLVPETALFYRAKRIGSLAISHTINRSLLPPAPLLISPEIARGAREHYLALDQANDPPGDREQAARDLIANAGLTGLTVPPRERTGEVRAQRIARRRGHLEQLREQLAPERFNAAHYRLLHDDLDPLSYEELVEHYLEYGRVEGRAAVLEEEAVRAVADRELDLEEYLLLNPDLGPLGTTAALRHFLQLGRHEDRRFRRTTLERYEAGLHRPEWLEEQLAQTHELEPLVPHPGPRGLRRLPWTGHAYHLEPRPAARAYWSVVEQLPARVDAMFIATWVRMGGGDRVLLRHLAAVRELRPDAVVVLITTDPFGSTHLHEVPEGVVVVELGQILTDGELSRSEREHLLATLIFQYGPSLVHVFNSALAFDTVEAYGPQLATRSNLFLTTFVIERDDEGAMVSPLLGRLPDFLDPVRAVITDQHALVDQLYELSRIDRSKFLVVHQAHESTTYARAPRPGTPAKILWAARFHQQKRLDILAEIAEALAAQQIPAELHVYGDATVPAPEIEKYLARLDEAGAVRHPAFTEGMTSLPLDDFAMFLLTSEREGIPLTVLDAISNGLPVVAPLVGGVGEVLTEATGFPVERFDDVAAHVAAITEVIADPDEAQRRAARAQELVREQFSPAAFEARLSQIPGYLPSPRKGSESGPEPGSAQE